ncbi:hypothetical protein Tco_0457583 [Tanacetum coccineum]
MNKKKKRSGEDEQSKRCYGLNNGRDEERWKSMAVSEKGARSEKIGLRQKDAATPNTQESTNSNLGN